jgi:deoxyribodipyrimidine photolyase-related protein
MTNITNVRNLVIILGDQLDPNSLALADFDAATDVIWMAEVSEESTHVWSHKTRIALFFAAMRQFADSCRAQGWRVDYTDIAASSTAHYSSLIEALQASVATHQPARIVWVKPGDYRVETQLRAGITALKLELDERPDQHFLVDLADFGVWAKGRKEFRLEHFYRHFRKKLAVLMQGSEPVGGQWNFDKENRKSFGRKGPGLFRAPLQFKPDATTAQAIADVERVFAEHPGKLSNFDWPVTPAQAHAALADFIEHRLAQFGDYQDAMWTDQPWLYHARLSAAMNLKLLHPKTVIDAAVAAYQAGTASLAAVEGFVRQILGWREFVRGLYWLRMPGYLEENALKAEQPLPDFYWSGKTDMNCLKHTLQQTLDYGYAHHIQRLMVTGNFALLLGIAPKAIHEWYLAVYVDAIEWVELPNTLGMSQFADGGMLASKPYCASGKYIERMSNYCVSCKYKPELRVGAAACPITTLYWDFLERHADRFAKHPRSALQWRAQETISPAERAQIKVEAAALRLKFADTSTKT